MRVGFIRTFELDNEVLWFFAVPAGSLVYFSSLVLLDREYDVASYVFGRVLVLFFWRLAQKARSDGISCVPDMLLSA